MGNKIFQLAREAVEEAEAFPQSSNIAVAKNNLSSAFANATNAEREQLQAMQQRLEECENESKTDSKYM